MKFLQSIAIFLLAVILSPWLLWHRWPFILHKRGKYKKAIYAYNKRLGSRSIQKHQGLINFNIGLAYKALGQIETSKIYFKRAMEHGCEFSELNFSGNEPLSPGTY